MRQPGQWILILCVQALLITGSAWAQQSRPAVNANTATRIAPQSRSPMTAVQPQAATPVETPLIVVLLGEVAKPGVYQTAAPNLTLGNLIQGAGGLTAATESCTVRFYTNGRSQAVVQLGRMLARPVQDNQVIYIASHGKAVERRASTTGVFRPVVVTGITDRPFVLNLGNESQNVQGLIQELGQPIEVLGHPDFVACQLQGLALEGDDWLLSNSIVHFPAELVNRGQFQAKLREGLSYLPALALNTGAASAPAPEQPRFPPFVQPPASRPNVAPPAARPQIPQAPAKLPPTTGQLLPGPLTSEIEPTGSEAPSVEPLRLPRFGDSSDEEESIPDEPAPEQQSAPADQVPAGRPPIMMPREWSTFEEETGEESDTDRKIERTSADSGHHNDGVILASAEWPAAQEPEPTPVQLTPEPDVRASESPLTLESWMAIAVTLGVGALSFVVTRIISQEDGRVIEKIQKQITAKTHEVVDESVAPAASADPDTEESRRFLQRLIVNQVPLVEEEPTLPPVDYLHGVVIGGRRMVVHDPHEAVAGPHFVVRDRRDTRPVERRLRAVLRESTAHSVDSAKVGTASTGPVRSSISPLEKALRNVERGGRP